MKLTTQRDKLVISKLSLTLLLFNNETIKQSNVPTRMAIFFFLSLENNKYWQGLKIGILIALLAGM